MALLLGTAALADDAAKTLTGTWAVSSDRANEGPTTWVIEQKPDSIKITEIRNSDTLAEFECNTMGRDCDIKEAGKKTKVSMWFNGDKLVELETRGSDTLKRRFGLNAAGDTMDVEIIPISSSGKPEVVQFKRVDAAVAKK